MSWINFFNRISLNEPGKIALIDEETGTRWSYRKLRLEVDRWASYFQKNGTIRGDRIALLAQNRIEHVSILLACAQIGAIFVPLNWRLSEHELQEIIDRIDPHFLIFESNNNLKTNGNVIDLNIWLLPSQYDYGQVSLNKDDPILMQFTSGTTGKPKGVLFHGEMLETNQWATVKEWGLKRGDVSVVETPFFHTGGYNVLLLPLLSIGGTVILNKQFSPEGTLDLLEREKVTVYFGVPTMFQRMAESKKFKEVNLEKIRFLISGGAPCPKELILKYQEKGLNFRQGFGMTEVGPNCFSLPEKDAIRKMGSVGRPMKHTKVMVLRENGEYAKAGEIGELLLGGPHVCKGYFKEDQKYKDSLHRGYFRSGDLVKFDEEGYFYIVGRIKDMYISGGENVYPAEVERTIKKHPHIEEVVVVSVPNEKWGEVGYAYIRGDKGIELQKLRRFLNPLLCRFKHPAHLEHLNDFPLLGSGKIDKKSLQEMALGRV